MIDDTKPSLIHGMQNIMKLPIEKKNKWNVIAYALNKDIIDSEGNIDPLRGMIAPIGSYDSEEKAMDKAKEVIEKTGHPAIKIIKYGTFAELSTNPDPLIVKTVTVDTKGKIMKLESEEYEKQKELYDKKLLYEKEIMKECEEECDIDHIEHYKRSAYLVTKHYMAYLELKKQSEQMYKNYELRKKVLKEHLDRHPEHEEEFLPYFKNKLVSRGEEELYYTIEKAYTTYKNVFIE